MLDSPLFPLLLAKTNYWLLVLFFLLTNGKKCPCFSDVNSTVITTRINVNPYRNFIRIESFVVVFRSSVYEVHTHTLGVFHQPCHVSRTFDKTPNKHPLQVLLFDKIMTAARVRVYAQDHTVSNRMLFKQCSLSLYSSR